MPPRKKPKPGSNQVCPAPVSRPAIKPSRKTRSPPTDTAGTGSAGSVPEPRIPIIGIGASAGGLEAFERFFRAMPASSGMAFVLVPHLDPGHASLLAEILQRNTTMRVAEATDQMEVEPDHVYIIPPNRDLAVFHGALCLSTPESVRGMRLPIDFFFRSLAEDQGERAIGVILSGSGSDGTAGLRAILGAGGVSFVQDPATAKYDGMPVSAVRSGLATYVLPVDKLAEQLVAYVHAIAATGIHPVPPTQPEQTSMKRILMLLRSRTGNDFSQYKQNTIHRRVERRMGVHNLETVDAYARYLHENPSEVHVLFKELLINVTSFFRDHEAFDAIAREVLPHLFADKPENYVFRVWVAGCATGEEAYSLAMLFREYMDSIHKEFSVQIYSTDLDEDEIATARSGVYPPNIAADLTPERLHRFFTRQENGYRIKKEIREMVIFAIQNVIKDPPFTRMDLISCRNLLIYLEADLQNRIIPAFHYSLRPEGFLFLSPSESIGGFVDLFQPVDKKWRIYRKKPSTASMRVLAGQRFSLITESLPEEPPAAAGPIVKTNYAELTRHLLLKSYAPPSLITDLKGNIIFVHGDTGKFLAPAQGPATMNAVDMAREGLQQQLRTAVQRVSLKKTPVVIRNLNVTTDDIAYLVDLVVRPIADPRSTQDLLLITFQDAEAASTEKRRKAQPVPRKGEEKRVEELEQELAYTRENLHATIEEMQAANEELKSTNEELQSTNEELQSTNEELETSKEELQSVNEEIVTVNAELQAKIEQLTGIQNDMKNLLENVNIGMIFLNTHLAISRFTAGATRVFRLVPSDTGRLLADIRSTIPDEDLVAVAEAVLVSLIPQERQVRTSSGEWYLVRIMPYRTLENVIDGVVMTFSDITALKEGEDELKVARDYAQNVLDTIREPLVVLTAGAEVLSASRAFYRSFRLTPEETVGRSFFALGNRQWDIPRLRDLLQGVMSRGESFEEFSFEHEYPGLGRRTLVMNARRIIGREGTTQLILLSIDEGTGKGWYPLDRGGNAGD